MAIPTPPPVPGAAAPAIPKPPAAVGLPPMPPQMPPAAPPPFDGGQVAAAPAMPPAQTFIPAAPPAAPAAPVMPAAPPSYIAASIEDAQLVQDQVAVQQAAEVNALQVAQAQQLGVPQGSPLAAVDFDNMTFAQIAEAQGLVGLDFNQYGVLPNCSLNQGQFKLSDGSSLGTEFRCVIQETKPKFLYKTSVQDTDPRHSVAYTYDHKTTNNKDLQEIIKGWAAQGMGYDVKNYLEMTCVLEDGRIILLSVPQTSISRFTQHVIQVTASRRLLSQVTTKVGIGPLVTKAVKPFSPLSFEIAKD